MNGKGGTGKSTLAALLVEYVCAKKGGSILAIDADPNSNLPELLGVKDAASIVGIVEDVQKHLDKLPSGITKDRFIEMKVQEAVSEEAKGFDLLVMGRPEGPGCYCYVNNLLRGIISKITKNYDLVIIDNAAGMEHISRRTMRRIDKLLLVSDYSVFGVRSAKKIYDLVREMDIDLGESYLVVNKLTGKVGALEKEMDASGLELAGAIPFDERLANLSISGRSIFKLDDSGLRAEVETIFRKVMKSQARETYGHRAGKGKI